MKAKQLLKTFFYDIYVDVSVALILIGYALWGYKNNFWSLLGISLIIISLPLWIVSRIHLGKSFAIGPKAHELKNHGIYSKIRHPMYLFSSLVALGIVLLIQNKYLFLLWIILLVIQFLRISSENELLRKTYGKKYQEYLKKTWF